ncbi:hypothetical protein M0R45_027470 [Rubus argutus]|uniref:Uncharacterized protein n=1 Tax=Rubus argutus TaxID=59490 RepID=A0AAW1X384_RUBAR
MLAASRTGTEARPRGEAAAVNGSAGDGVDWWLDRGLSGVVVDAEHRQIEQRTGAQTAAVEEVNWRRW